VPIAYINHVAFVIDTQQRCSDILRRRLIRDLHLPFLWVEFSPAVHVARV
jgi:hypothetical protein